MTNRNRVFATGFGDTYALGFDKPVTICSFREVGWFSQAFNYSEPIERLSCGVSHSGCIISGKCYFWGILGMNSSLHFKKPVLVNIPGGSSIGSSYTNIHSKELGGNTRKSYAKDRDLNVVLDIKLGDLLTVVLTKKGEVYAMGENSFNQLGSVLKNNADYSPTLVKVPFDDPNTCITAIACGNNHVLVFCKETRTTYGWGCNGQGQLIPYNIRDEQ